MAQLKLLSINQTLGSLRSRTNAEPITNRDDINLNNNYGYATLNNVINGNKNDLKLKQNLNVSSLSLENNNIITPERRNSAVSTGSATQYLASNSSKMRPRCDSYGGQSSVQNYTTASISSEKLMHSPTYSYQQQIPIPHLHYKSHADKVAYVTNAVANAAANATPLISLNNNGNAMPSPKYGRLKPLTVDTSINESYYYPPSGSANHQHRTHFQQPHYTQHQHQHRHSPYTTSRSHLTPTKVKHSISHLHVTTKPAISDDEDDIAGQYATLLTLSEQPKHSMHQDTDNQESDTHYSEILCRKPSAPLPLTERNHFQAKDSNGATKSQGLGGYWTTNENNERVWLSVDNR